MVLKLTISIIERDKRVGTKSKWGRGWKYFVKLIIWPLYYVILKFFVALI